MVEPELVLHAALVLTWDEGPNQKISDAVQSALSLSDEDKEDALAHINANRGDGDWGGSAEKVLARATQRVQEAFDSEMLDGDDSILSTLLTGSDADEEEVVNEEDVDPFVELGVESMATSQNGGEEEEDALSALMDGEEDDEVEDMLVSSEPVETEVVEIGVEEEIDDDEDPFSALGISGPAVALDAGPADDPLSALMDDEDEDEEDIELGIEVDSSESSEVESDSKTSSKVGTKEAYRMVLETVWVDGVLDPAEVNLLARRRKEFGLSFEQHLTMVRELLGD